MLSAFDWISRSRTGSELLAVLECLSDDPDVFVHSEECGIPYSALSIPCQRCWIYSRISSSEKKDYLYCKSCQKIISRSRSLRNKSHRAMIIWGFVNQLPKQFNDTGKIRLFGYYIHDRNRFLLMMPKKELKPWLQELALYNSSAVKGLIQILPTTGPGKSFNMGDILCRVIHNEAKFPMDLLRIRFYSRPYQVLMPHEREKQGILTFDISEFLKFLEMASIFRRLLLPEEQKMLHEVLSIKDPVEEQFYWGRFQGNLSQPTKDMLNAWKIRFWSKNQIKLLYELIDYVILPESN